MWVLLTTCILRKGVIPGNITYAEIRTSGKVKAFTNAYLMVCSSVYKAYIRSTVPIKCVKYNITKTNIGKLWCIRITYECSTLFNLKNTV